MMVINRHAVLWGIIAIRVIPAQYGKVAILASVSFCLIPCMLYGYIPCALSHVNQHTLPRFCSLSSFSLLCLMSTELCSLQFAFSACSEVISSALFSAYSSDVE